MGGFRELVRGNAAMKKYLGGRLVNMAARLRLISNSMVTVERIDGLQAVIESMEASVTLLKMYQYEWTMQMVRGMEGDMTPDQVGEQSQGGLIRII